ncbi:methyltransferase [bacterium]|nr:methyltransferase [bacterium]
MPFLGENEFVTKYECLSPDPNLKESIIIRQNFPDPDDLIDLAKELGFECINDSRKTPKGENDFYFHLTLKKLEEKNKSTPIKDYYDKAAPEYSQTLEKFRYKVPSELPALIAEDWSNTNPKVLDLGCGNGWLAQTLTQLKISPSQLHGVDLSINMLKEAKNNFNFNATLQWDLNNKLSPFLEGSQYELVFLLGTSEFLDSLEQWIINTYSLLTLGGDFIFTVEDVNKKTIDAISQGKSYKTKRQYSKDDVLALLKKHHFDILDSIAIPSSYYSPGLNNEAVNYHLFRARKNQ